MTSTVTAASRWGRTVAAIGTAATLALTAWAPASAEARIAPWIDVHTKLHQLGGWIHIKGAGFTPGRGVTFWVTGLERTTGPRWLGSTGTDGAGAFGERVFDVRCWPGQQGSAMVYATDDATGVQTGKQLTTAYSCG